MSFVTHLECANCGQRYDANRLHNLCTACQKPLWVRYDLDAVKRSFPKQALRDRPQTLWRYHELLPVRDDANTVSLGETVTPMRPSTPGDGTA